MRLSQQRWQGLARAFLWIYALATVYFVLGPMLGLPGHGAGASLLTLIGFAFALAHSRAGRGCPRTMLLLALTFVVSLLFETVGGATGWIYGPYHYSDMLGPRFLGLVPYLIPVAWFMMVYPSHIVAQVLIGGRSSGRWRDLVALAAVAAVVMTAWDLLMDPMMSRIGFWTWEVEGAYFGVPLQNYAGWLVTTFTVYLLYELLAPLLRGLAGERPGPRFGRMALWAYLITWLGNSVGALRLGLGGAALAGAFSMGAFVLLALLRNRDDGGKARGKGDQGSESSDR